MDDWERPYRLANPEYSLENHGQETWREAELWVVDRHDWTDVDEPTHDATEPLFARADIEKRVETKCTLARYNDGTVGRLTIWPAQIVADELAVVVYDETAGGIPGVVAHSTVSTSEIDFTDTKRQKHPTMGWTHYVHPRWNDVLSLDDVRLEFQDEFQDLFV
jgi:hypothetical protein